MSARTVEAILRRALQEPAFVELLFSQPTVAISGYDLTPEEVIRLLSIKKEDFLAALAVAKTKPFSASDSET